MEMCPIAVRSIVLESVRWRRRMYRLNTVYTVCGVLCNSLWCWTILVNVVYIPCTPNTSLPSLSSVHTVLHDHKDGTSLWWVYHTVNKALELVDLWVSRTSQPCRCTSHYICSHLYTYHNQFSLHVKSEMQHHLVVLLTHCLQLTGLLAGINNSVIRNKSSSCTFIGASGVMSWSIPHHDLQKNQHTYVTDDNAFTLKSCTCVWWYA